MPILSNRSKSKLSTVDLRLQKVLKAVIDVYDFTVLDGYRSEEMQNKAYKSGKSRVKYPNSKHNTFPSKAIDIAPWPIPPNWGNDSWKDMVKFYEMAAIVLYEAAKQGVSVRWGGDWDGDGDYKDNKFDDLVHFEIGE